MVRCSSLGISAAFWALEVMGQNIQLGFILKMRNYWSVGAGVPTEKLWMRDAGGGTLSLGWVSLSQQNQNTLFIFKVSLQDLETKVT